MRMLSKFFAACAALVVPFAGVASGQTIISSGQSFVDGALIAGNAQRDGTRMAGLRLRLSDGWKTYWRTPGEAGVPPSLDWSASRNVRDVMVYWPTPVVFDSYGMRTVGYEREVILPLAVIPVDASRPVDLALVADIGVCKHLCVFEQLKLSQQLSADEPGMHGDVIEAAMAMVPVDAHQQGLREASCRIEGTGAERSMTAVIRFDQALRDPVVLLEGGATQWFWDDRSLVRDAAEGAIDVSARLTLADGTAWIDRSAIRMTVLADGFAADIRGCKAPAG